MTTYFVWVGLPSRPEPQLWNDKPADGNGKDKLQPLPGNEHIVGKDDPQTLDGLMALYPYKDANNEPSTSD